MRNRIDEVGFLDDYGKAAVIGGEFLGTLIELTTRILSHVIELKELSNENPKIKSIFFPGIEKVEEKVRKIRKVAKDSKGTVKGTRRNGIFIDSETPKEKRLRRRR